MSLQARLLAGLAAIGVVLATVALVVTTTTRANLVDQVDDRLLVATEDERGAGLARGERPARGDGGPTGTPPERLSDVYEGVVGPDGELTTFYEPNIGDGDLGPPEIDAATLQSLEGSAFFTAGASDGDGQYRVLARRSGDRVFITALPLRTVRDTVARLILLEVLGVGAVLAVLGAVAWWVIRLGIRPIKQMTATAAEVSTATAAGLAVRVPEAAPHTESGRLATALNAMLDRIETTVDERARSEERLRRFVADASHELRTPVTTIRGYAELYRHGGLDDPGELGDAMRRTEQEARRMGRLVEDMLTLAKLDHQRPLDRAPVDVVALVTDAGRDARAVAPDRRITIETDRDLVVAGDADRLRQVLANVVGNVIVHTPAGSPVVISAHRRGGDAVVEVVDQGPGMPAEVASRVTERFYRADPSRSRARGGSGLGMAIVDAVVGAHGGTVGIDSRPGRGTTVTLVIPTATAPPDGANAPSGEPSPHPERT